MRAGRGRKLSFRDFWDDFPELRDTEETDLTVPRHSIFGDKAVVASEFKKCEEPQFSKVDQETREEMRRAGRHRKVAVFEKSALVDMTRLEIKVRPLPEAEQESIRKHLQECALLEKSGIEETEDDRSDAEDEDDDYMSGVWRRLSCYDEFVVTHPNFNIYRQMDKHWSLNVKVPRSSMEKAREKCEQWLASNSDPRNRRINGTDEK